jgi:hypothetical protein
MNSGRSRSSNVHSKPSMNERSTDVAGLQRAGKVEMTASTPAGRDNYALELGLFVLGALPAEERLELERHLTECEACRIENDELSDIPMFLALLDEDFDLRRDG